MSNSKQIAVCAISPIHFISAIGACRSLHGTNRARVDLLVHWPGIDDRFSDELFKIFLKLSAAADEVRRVVGINQASVNALRNFCNDRQRVEAVHSMTRTPHYDEIYYPHDVVGDLYPVLAGSYPDARRVCIGDGLGIVYERQVHLSYLGLSPETDPMTGFRAPDMAALFLPVDQSGNFLKKVPLLVCPKRILEEVIEQCIAATPELQDYIQILLNTYQERPKILLLTENNAEGGFIDFDREIEMYAEMILPLIEKNSVVIIKPHPGETLPRSQRIQEILKMKTETIALHEKFNRYPIELWRGLVGASKVVCMSYPALSLKYLYQIDVLNPMNDDFIKRWFHQNTWKSYSNSTRLYLEPIKKLQQWNQNGVLWDGLRG